MSKLILALLVSVNWLTLPSTYTHRNGKRVNQYSQPVAPVAREPEQRRVQTRRYQRSWLQNGWSVDNYYRIERTDGK